MSYYLIVSTVVIFFGAFIWSSKDFPNVLVKMFLFAVGGYGLFVTLQQFGYVLHK